MSAGESLLSSDEQLPYQSDKYKSIRACVKTLNAKSKMDPKGGNSFEGFLLRKSLTTGIFSPYWVVLDPSTGYLSCYKSQAVCVFLFTLILTKITNFIKHRQLI